MALCVYNKISINQIFQHAHPERSSHVHAPIVVATLNTHLLEKENVINR
jgi:hypothetical protein